MAKVKTVWGIDIGQVALKALRLRDEDGQLRVDAFEIIEHPTILSQPEVDRPQLIREALQQFLSRQSLAGAEVVISVPGQSSFSRFVKLPPVEAKRVPDIVRFEAEQQIPFPINEVIWRWQTFRDPDSPDVEVGIFAMKRLDVAEMLSHFAQANLRIDTVQMAPLALYNFMTFDEQLADDGATLLADVGADKTDLVVADKGRIWTRTIQIGGNNFTEALVRTFKLSFDKAEKLKRTAASSKYARQIFQAMRPVFADLVQEIQRSIGYYTSLHRDTRFRRLLGLGNGFRLPGLQKFMEQNLNIPVARIDSYNKLSPSSAINAHTFNENVLSFAVSYGLAVQGLERSSVSTNLLPEQILRRRLWNKKRPWFVAAAVVLLAAVFCPGYRARLDSKTLADQSKLRTAQKAAKDLNRRISDYNQIGNEGRLEEDQIEHFGKLFSYRDFWPSALTMVYQSVEAVAPNQPRVVDYARYLELGPKDREVILDGQDVPDQALDTLGMLLLGDEDQKQLNALVKGSAGDVLKRRARALAGETRDALKTPVDANAVADLDDASLRKLVKKLFLARKIKQIEAFKNKKRDQRQVIYLERLTATYLPDLAAAKAGARAGMGAGGQPGFKIDFTGRTPLPREQANDLLSNLRLYSADLAKWLSPIVVDAHQVDWLPMVADRRGTRSGAEGPALPDPLMPDEDMTNDTRFQIVWWLKVTHDGIVMADVKVGRKYVLSKPVELLPELDSADASAAAKRAKMLAPGSTIAVEAVEIRWTTPWFRVTAADAQGKALGTGWVDGAALDEQRKQLKEAAAAP